MHSWLKNLTWSFTKESSHTAISVICFVLLLRYIGALQAFGLAAYDLLFFLRPSEPKDERIVLVTWDETQIQATQETTMSDKTLASLIKKINEQQPRVIGLDIYRDNKVESPLLSDRQNQVAYSELQAVFRSTPNLVGIEKVIEPKTNPPLVLKKLERTAAADLASDSDGLIRRAFIYPLEDKNGNPAEIPSFGFLISYQYLAKERFLADRIERNNALHLTNPETGKETTIEPLKRFDGSYLKKAEGTSVMVNWRKGNPFKKVSVSEVLSNSISPDIFQDKIVLIGNTAISTSDRHFLPINRWVKPQPQWSYGVEVQAQIVSYVVSSALDGRTLIRPLPEWLEIGLIIITLWSIALIAEKYAAIRPWRLFITTILGTIIILFGLVFLSYLAFIKGYWLPIVPSFLGGLVYPPMICTAIYIRKLNATNEDFKRLLKDINHSLQNPLRALNDNVEIARYIAVLIEENNTAKLEEIARRFNKSPSTNLRENLDKILVLNQKVNYLRDNAQKYFGVAYLGKKIFNKKPTNLNRLVKDTFASVIPIKEIEYDIAIAFEERYDKSIEDIELDPRSIERVLENLIDNAFYAIKARISSEPTHQGKIAVHTRKRLKRVEIAISDNGTGINSSIIKQIFLPFKSFKARGKGQGLGLAIAKETLLFHGGRIEVKTQEGVGSIFMVFFAL